MVITLGEASRQTGKSKAAIIKAIPVILMTVLGYGEGRDSFHDLDGAAPCVPFRPHFRPGTPLPRARHAGSPVRPQPVSIHGPPRRASDATPGT